MQRDDKLWQYVLAATTFFSVSLLIDMGTTASKLGACPAYGDPLRVAKLLVLVGRRTAQERIGRP